MRRQSSNQKKSFLSNHFQNFQISPSKLNEMVLEALHLDQPRDIVGAGANLEAFKQNQIELRENSTIEERRDAERKLSNLFVGIFDKIMAYFSEQGIDVSKFSNEVIKKEDSDEYIAGELGDYIAKMIVNNAAGIDNETYSELLTVANNIVDFVNMVASRASQDGISDADKQRIMQQYIANLPLTTADLNCIPGVAERFETLTNELKQSVVVQNYVASKVVAEGYISRSVSEGSQIHVPLFLKMFLGVVDEKTADKNDRFVIGLKTKLETETCWQAVQSYYQEFNNNFIGLITEQLKDLLDEKGNVFGVEYADLYKGSTYAELNKKLKKALENLGLTTGGHPIVEFINQDQTTDETTDESAWKTPEEIVEIITGKLIEKYPALTKINSPEERLESVLEPIKQISSSNPKYIADLLKSGNSDQVLIGLQAIYLAVQPFLDNVDGNNYDLMVAVIYSQIDPQPETPEEFALKAQDFLEKLKTRIPADQHFKIEDLKTRCQEEKIVEKLLLPAIQYENDALKNNLKHIKDDNLIFNAARFGYEKAITNIIQNSENKKLLLEKTDHNDQTVLHCAVLNGHLEAIEAILKNCGNENKKALLERETSSCRSILFSALRRGRPEAIEVILKNCGDGNKKYLLEKEINYGGVTILHFAAFNGHLEATKAILENCGDGNKKSLIEQADERGETALLKAAFRGNIEIFKLLHENGADITNRSLGQKRSSLGSLFFKNNIHKETPVGIILGSFLRPHSSDCENKLQQLFSVITPDHLNINNKKIAREIEVFRAKASPNLKLIVEENMRKILTPSASLGSRVAVSAIVDNGPQHLM